MFSLFSAVMGVVAVTGVGINTATMNASTAAIYAAMLPTSPVTIVSIAKRPPLTSALAAVEATVDSKPSGWTVSYSPPSPATGVFSGYPDWLWLYNGSSPHLEVTGEGVGTGSKSNTLSWVFTGPSNAVGNVTFAHEAYGVVEGSGSASSSITLMGDVVQGACGSNNQYLSTLTKSWSMGLGASGSLTLNVPVSASATITGP